MIRFYDFNHHHQQQQQQPQQSISHPGFFNLQGCLSSSVPWPTTFLLTVGVYSYTNLGEVCRPYARSNSLPNCLNQTLLHAADDLLGQNINENKQ